MRVKLGPLITDARGTLGDTVWSVWRAGVHWTRVESDSRTDPNTELQQFVRANKADALNAWSALSELIKALWETYRKLFDRRNQDDGFRGGTTNLIPHHRPPLTAQMAFVQAYLRLARARTKVWDNPATGNQPTLVSDLAVAWDAVNNELDITWNDPPDGSYVATDYYQEDFEDETLGDTPDLWTPAWVFSATGTETIEIDTAQAHSGTKSAKQIVGSGVAYACYGIAALATQHDIVIDHWFYYNVLNAQTAMLHVGNCPLTTVAVTVKSQTGNVHYGDGGVYTVGPAIANNTWHKFRYVLHPGTRTWDLYFNDMCNPVEAGMLYWQDFDATAIYMIVLASTAWIDDIHVYYSNYLLRTWLLSYAGGAHKQLLCHTPVNLGEAHPTDARYALGVLAPLDSNRGLYYIQCDVLAIDEIQNGLLGVPSQIFRTVVD